MVLSAKSENVWPSLNSVIFHRQKFNILEKCCFQSRPHSLMHLTEVTQFADLF